MTSDETMTVVSSMVEDDYDDIDIDIGFGFGHDHDHQAHPHNLSRLSMCTSSMNTNEEDDDDDDDHNHLGTYISRLSISRLSIESFDADVDEEDLHGKELLQLSSDSDKEPSCYSLPATPSRRRNRSKGVLAQGQQLMGVAKDYASENEAEKGSLRRSNGNKNLRKRSIIRERWANTNQNKDDELMVGYSNHSGSFSGESEGGLVVITRPKGGQRPLCMDMEEVKACRDLGFELEMPSSGENSPIANWRISSPGDDPRDVKARLKVWAQAVALASTSRHCS